MGWTYFYLFRILLFFPAFIIYGLAIHHKKEMENQSINHDLLEAELLDNPVVAIDKTTQNSWIWVRYMLLAFCAVQMVYLVWFYFIDAAGMDNPFQAGLPGLITTLILVILPLLFVFGTWGHDARPSWKTYFSDPMREEPQIR